MRYETAEAFRTALEQRLKNDAERRGIALMRLRKGVAFERFLARLAAIEAGDWVLKGAFALELRLGLRTRTTKDIDLGRADDEEAATEHLSVASAVSLGDFFDFEVRRTPALDDAEGFRAVRYTVRAELAGRLFEQFPVDVALGGWDSGQAEELLVPGLLEFADIPGPWLPVVGLEQHVAEKLHAYTATYGVDGDRSTRVKDLIDLVLIGERTQLDADRLGQAVSGTFMRREGQPLPRAVPPPPSAWARPYAELARQIGIEADMHAGHAAVAKLLDSTLEQVAEGRCNPTVNG